MCHSLCRIHVHNIPIGRNGSVHTFNICLNVWVQSTILRGWRQDLKLVFDKWFWISSLVQGVYSWPLRKILKRRETNWWRHRKRFVRQISHTNYCPSATGQVNKDDVDLSKIWMAGFKHKLMSSCCGMETKMKWTSAKVMSLMICTSPKDDDDGCFLVRYFLMCNGLGLTHCNV